MWPADRVHIFPGVRSLSGSNGMDVHFSSMALSWREFKFIWIFIENSNIYNFLEIELLSSNKMYFKDKNLGYILTSNLLWLIDSEKVSKILNFFTFSLNFLRIIKKFKILLNSSEASNQSKFDVKRYPRFLSSKYTLFELNSSISKKL